MKEGTNEGTTPLATKFHSVADKKKQKQKENKRGLEGGGGS